MELRVRAFAKFSYALAFLEKPKIFMIFIPGSRVQVWPFYPRFPVLPLSSGTCPARTLIVVWVDKHDFIVIAFAAYGLTIFADRAALYIASRMVGCTWLVDNAAVVAVLAMVVVAHVTRIDLPVYLYMRPDASLAALFGCHVFAAVLAGSSHILLLCHLWWKSIDDFSWFECTATLSLLILEIH